MKILRVKKSVKEIKFEEKYKKLTLVFMLNSAQREKFTVYFSRIFFYY